MYRITMRREQEEEEDEEAENKERKDIAGYLCQAQCRRI